jgi:large subunit ribosomal protein L5
MWKIKEGDVTGCKVTIFGDQAYEFVDKLVNLVLPKIKDWPGLKGKQVAPTRGR